MYYINSMANVLPLDRQVTVIGSLVEGSSIRAIERMIAIGGKGGPPLSPVPETFDPGE